MCFNTHTKNNMTYQSVVKTQEGKAERGEGSELWAIKNTWRNNESVVSGNQRNKLVGLQVRADGSVELVSS